jgi:hypothetical protein
MPYPHKTVRPPALLFLSALLTCATLAQSLEKPTRFEPGINLPDGPGRTIVLASCTSCHDLKGLPAYKGYWNKQQWLAMIGTMVQHGARLGPGDAAQLADYLSEHFGKR